MYEPRLSAFKKDLLTARRTTGIRGSASAPPS